MPRPSYDLSQLLHLQLQLMHKLGLAGDLMRPGDLESPLLLEALVMLAGEVSEAVDPLLVRSKPWKRVNPVTRKAEVEEEVIDILFFWLEVALLLGWTQEDVSERYLAKWQRNFERANPSEVEVAALSTQLSLPLDKPSPPGKFWWEQQPLDKLLAGTERLAGLLSDPVDRFSMWQVTWTAQEAMSARRGDHALTQLQEAWAHLWPSLDSADRDLVGGEFKFLTAKKLVE